MNARKLGKSLLMALLIVCALTTLAAAHAYLEETSAPAGAVFPQSPRELNFRYSEAIESSFSSFRLFSEEGTELARLTFSLDPQEARSARIILPELPPGVYTISWQVLSSVDGHVTKGSFPFGVGPTRGAPATVGGAAPSSEPLPSAVRLMTRWAGLLALLALTGGIFVSLVIIRPLGLPALDLSLRALWMSWGLSLLALLSDFFFQALEVSGASLWQLFREGWLLSLVQTRYGLLTVGRVLLMLILTLLLHRARRSDWILAGVGALLLLSLSLSSHSAAVASGVGLAVLADWLHATTAGLYSAVPSCFSPAFTSRIDIFPISRRPSGTRPMA